ncbi:MAG: hypothetical protein RQ741_05290 [Wenzhouxiangellaceae bacterium]|nr:hypothetical protein [Wenzhouxiangellaceae bacterium]
MPSKNEPEQRSRQPSQGSSNSDGKHDPEQVMQKSFGLARKMISRWGMSKQLGPAAFSQSEDHMFLGKEMAQRREHSDATAAIIDEEIHDLLEDIESRATNCWRKIATVSKPWPARCRNTKRWSATRLSSSWKLEFGRAMITVPADGASAGNISRQAPPNTVDAVRASRWSGLPGCVRPYRC